VSRIGEALEGEVVEDGFHEFITVDGLAFTQDRGDDTNELVASVGVQGARTHAKGAIILTLNDAAQKGVPEVTTQGLFHTGSQAFIA
jgi:uncharacterized protein (UPF0210 family)